jgi:hypothetical protein
MKEETQVKRTKWPRLIRILIWVSTGLFASVTVLVVAITIPSVQTYVAQKFIKSLSEKTRTSISLESVSVKFPGKVILNGLFLNDKNSDTLLFLHSLRLNINLLKLMRNEISVDGVTLENVVANIRREENENAFNFQFILNEFKPDNNDKPISGKEPGKAWLIDLKRVQLKNIRASYDDFKSRFNGRLNVGEFDVMVKEIDPQKKLFSFGEIKLKNTLVQLGFAQQDTINKVDNIGASTNDLQRNQSKSIFLDMTLIADQLSIENTKFKMDKNSAKKNSEGIDYKHLDIEDLHAGIENIRIDSKGYQANIKQLSLSESSGLNLKLFSAEAKLTDQLAGLKNLQFETTESSLSGGATIEYVTFDNLLNDFRNTNLTIDLKNSHVIVNDVFMIVPSLAEDKNVGKFKNTDVLLTIKTDGKVSDLNIENLEMSVLQNTVLKARGKIKGFPEIDKLGFDVVFDQLSANMIDIQKFVDPSVFAGLSLPKNYELNGTIKGKLDSLKADIQLTSAYGNIMADAFYSNKNPTFRDTFAVDFTSRKILAGRIFSDTVMGEFNFSGKIKGSGLTTASLSGSAEVDIQSAEFNRYAYNNIHIESKITENVLSAWISSADSNLNFQLSGDADLNEPSQKYAAQLDLFNANLHALHFTDKRIKFGTKLKADVNFGGLDNSIVNLKLENTVFQNETKLIPLNLLYINAISENDSIIIDMKSDFADGKINGNISPEHFQQTFISAYKKYFGIADTSQLQPARQMAFTINPHFPHDILEELLPGIDTLRITKLEGLYKSDNNELTAELCVPEAIYSDMRFDSLRFVANGKDESLSLHFMLGSIRYKNMLIDKFSIKEQIDKGKILSEITISDSIGKPRYFFANEVELNDNTLSVKFLPNGLVLDGESWDVNETNVFTKKQNEFSTQQFVFSNGNQSIGFVANGDSNQISFSNFALQNLINIIEYEKIHGTVRGDLDGKIDFSLLGNQEYINADLKINSLYILDKFKGSMLINLKNEKDRLDINTQYFADQNNISLVGILDHLNGIPEFDLELVADINDLNQIQKFSFGTLSEMSGKINSELSLKGTFEKPIVNGFIGFEETDFKITSLNFLARIKNEKLLISEKGIHFDDFAISDTLDKKLMVNGDILTEDFNDVGVDLRFTTNDFQPMNSTSKDNKVFYGKLSLATDISLKGELKNPDIEAQIKLDSSTNLIYALPGTELKLETSEGIVNFLKPHQRYDSVYFDEEVTSLADSIMSGLSGINLSVNLEIDQNANFTIDIDPKSGDYLSIGGSAKLKINVDRSGKQSINGIYQVKSGLYELSFYNLVKKTFIIVPGSTVVWTGNPKDADVNITANYTVTTPSTALMTTEANTMSDAEKKIFKQRLPYEVNLNIMGFLSEPKISFNIGLPEKYLAANPMIASKLTLLNSEDHIDALNKQVFALLVTGSFIPDNSSSGATNNVASTAARNSVNDILAGQMNNFSGKYIRNVDVNFGLTTFEDGTEGSTDPTTELDIQVSKKLFDERVTIEAQSSFDVSGNKNTSPTSSDHNSGEVAVTYKLTRKGDYKLKAFSQTAYDLFDGDIVSSGIALIFQKEFESLKRKKKQGDITKRNELKNAEIIEESKSEKQ